jgi:hypothetical protein
VHELITSKDLPMTLRQFRDLLAPFSDDAEILVSLFMSDGTVKAFRIDGVDEDYGIVHIEVSEEMGIIY